jgi:hypothetical protein
MGSMTLVRVKELTMTTPTSPPRDCLDQLHLFVGPSPRPAWSDLSDATRKRLTELLSEMLSHHLPHPPASDREAEVTHE